MQNGVTSKLVHSVTYPERLDLHQCFDSSLQQLSEAAYELEGVLLHDGTTMDKGHYHGVHHSPWALAACQ